MITRTRHRNLFATQQREHNVSNDKQQPTAIYDTLAKSVTYWNILGLQENDALIFENLVVGLLQHLPEAHDLQNVENLVCEIFAEKQGYTKFTPEQLLMLKFLADDIWSAWTRYLQRNEDASFAQKTHARSRIRSHYYPRTHSR